MRIAVVGAGIVGLAVTYELARQGHDVRCFEAAQPMRAQSVGDARIFRLAHATPTLVSAAQRALTGWRVWNQQAGRPLLGIESVVISGQLRARTAAMDAAGVAHEVVDRAPNLPVPTAPGPFLLDPAGGVIHAAATGRFLLQAVSSTVVAETVARLTDVGDGISVATAHTTQIFDSVVLAAGAGTPDLAAQVGIDIPNEWAHHVRFTFALRNSDAIHPCWLDASGSWRAGFSAYSQTPGPGRWAIGGNWRDEIPIGDIGRGAFIEESRRIATRYVREHVPGAAAEVVDTVWCHHPRELGDGVRIAREGRVLAVWGDHLFKVAPLIGGLVADAAVHMSTPDSIV